MNCVSDAETHMKSGVFVHVIIAAEYLLTEDFYFRCTWCIFCILRTFILIPKFEFISFLSKLTDLPFNFNQKKNLQSLLSIVFISPQRRAHLA